MNASLRLLLVEDDADDRALFADVVEEVGRDWATLRVATSFEEGVHEATNGTFDVIISDYRLGTRNGIELLTWLRSKESRTPFILLTGAGGHDIDLEATRCGADDYIPKSNLTAATLERAVRYALAKAEARTTIERSREDMLAILDQLRMGIAMIDQDERVVFLSRNCRQMLGLSEAECAGQPWAQLCPIDKADKDRIVEMAELPAAQRQKLSVQMAPGPGRRFWMDIEILDDVRDSRGKILFLYDMTEVHDLRQMLNERVRFGDLVGKCDAMQQIFHQIRELARVEATVLIEGETGTGKELAARAIHFNGQRKDKPFVTVNCAGLTESLLSSQLFGHRRGAFTGAVDDQKGVFEAAEGGTVFLDEIGDISPAAQTSLLRVIQEKEITRLGETRSRTVDVRIMTATHRDLNAEVDAGRFRQDLLYRIRVARITLPPLRARRADIPLLVEAFLAKFRASIGKRVVGVSPDALGLLMNHAWPGNVRELQSAMEFGVIRASSAVLGVDDLPPEVHPSPRRDSSANSSHEDERQRLLAALDASKGSRSAAAQLLGVSRSTLYRRLTEYGIK